ncbi:M48 family metallopeptidase [Tenacibaculum piscium]|uniref:Peptidase M48 n=1 Tax=Tenacibaculum piscium TaxID=1458515 RepID=A0A2H1YGQ4_9FLAO|nr:M48 family metallopeptidase [Tenacibaculum piscium]MBE7630274.1 M48 family metalloprotease [Tenacibaculum piscium]MBE7670867.1 M48 family metalloprotease [Tenacibaculum piscium]MBE7685707.1 M48 family metalloprotease [Tenacibaculum piscium]MBE7690302.1 M48 family metalloprotease [Tenacibaculum piscium]MCG8184046.1 M48 family metallopeptidase [Tenacibaculum piscium]
MKKIIALGMVALFLVQCSTVPITGRKRLNFVSDAQVLPASFAQYKGFLQENKLSTNATKSNQIKRVGKNISSAVDRFMRANGMTSEANSYRWEFNLVEDNTVNAWCMPGGKVVFYTGILPICANEDGIAAVMGHEVAHAFAKHGQERMSTGQLQQLGGAAVALGTANSKNAQLFNTAYGLGTQVGIMLPFSRSHETEADKLGLVFMIMAGYNGREAAEVWVRMSQMSKGKAPAEFMSTHPSNQTRIRTLRAYLPEAKQLAAKFNRGVKG